MKNKGCLEGEKDEVKQSTTLVKNPLFQLFTLNRYPCSAPKCTKCIFLFLPLSLRFFTAIKLSMMIYHCYLKGSSSSVGLFSHSGAFLVISPFFFLSLIFSVAQSYRYSNTPPQFFGAFQPSAGKFVMSAASTVLSPHASSAFTSRRRFSTATSHSTSPSQTLL